MSFRHLHKTGSTFYVSMEAIGILTPGRKLHCSTWPDIFPPLLVCVQNPVTTISNLFATLMARVEFLHTEHTGCFDKLFLKWDLRFSRRLVGYWYYVGFLCRVVCRLDANVSDKNAVPSFKPRRWRQHVSTKRWHLLTTPHGAKTQHQHLFSGKNVLLICWLLSVSLFICYATYSVGEPGSSVSIVSGCGLNGRAIEVRSPAEAKDFYSNPCVQTSSEVHPASCTVGTVGKARPRRDADHSSHLLPIYRMSRSYTSSLGACMAEWDSFTLSYYTPRSISCLWSHLRVAKACSTSQRWTVQLSHGACTITVPYASAGNTCVRVVSLRCSWSIRISAGSVMPAMWTVRLYMGV
jgi:hypothetical protein